MAGSLYSQKDKIRELSNEPFQNGMTPEPYRTPWRRDYARLIHCPSFRRLQGKTQLFPGVESDFFRNRLTHSIEVAQIAKSIALRLNHNYNTSGKIRKSRQKKLDISTDLIEFSGLAHDLGHPPFGHQGEEALDECMVNFGGFEGNAQSLRLLSRIEKKFKANEDEIDGNKDSRVGLNLCMRTLASVLKYDKVIPESEEDRKELAKDSYIKPVKGYYKCDKELVDKIKSSVLRGKTVRDGDFKTIECTIMDIADDIAYSTYDLEDAFKAGFISPMDLLFPQKALLKEVTLKVNENLKKEGVKKILKESEIVDIVRENLLSIDGSQIVEGYSNEDLGKYIFDFSNSLTDLSHRTSRLIARDGYLRTEWTSSVVGMFIRGVELEYNSKHPALSKAKLNDETRILVEILKTFTFKSQITSPRLKIAEFRGKEIVKKIFETLSDGGEDLLPKDVRKIYNQANGTYKKRIICDYVSSMTDRYAIEFYGRLTSENPETIFKPY